MKNVFSLMQYRALAVFLWCVLGVSCASQGTQPPNAENLPPFPEVLHITFMGNAYFSSSTLRKAMEMKQRPFFPPWRRGEPYNPLTLEADVLRLKKFYFDRGFLTCVVRLEEVQENLPRQTVEIRITIEEGPQTMVSTVALAGTRPPALPSETDLVLLLPLRSGQPLTKDNFDRSKAVLLTHLHNAGYARAQIIPQTEVDPAQHTAAVTFTLEPGAETTFGTISIQGARQVDERAIRRHLTIQEGQQVSDKALSASADAIYNLGMFQAVTPHALNPEAMDEPFNVAFEVIERKPRSLQFGLGYSTTAGFRTEVQWIYRNLYRGAQQLTLAGRLSSLEQKIETRLVLPYVLVERTALTATLFVRNEQEIDLNPVGEVFPSQRATQPAFDLLSIGAETRVEHRWTETLTSAVGLSVSRNDFRHVHREALSAIEQEIAADNFLLIYALEGQWNTSDSVLNPSHGLVLRGRVEHADRTLLSDVNFFKLTLEGRHYLPLGWNLLLATRLKIGGIYAYEGTTEVPFNVRFFAGGAGSIRGFPLNQLGPKNTDGDPIGGQSLFEASGEIRFPLFGDFAAAVFADVGNVFRAPFTYRWDTLRYAIGPGLRYNTPVGPVRLDVGVILGRRPGEEFGRVEFSIGQAF
jgi:outer membrane protein assembly complex protein YaeT